MSETVRNLERELDVDLLERKRSGATMSAAGRELLPYIVGVLEAVDRLREAAGEQHRISRMVHVGTLNAATVPLTAMRAGHVMHRYVHRLLEGRAPAFSCSTDGG
ncbi:hypothetical protein [Streptomyces sp. NPDC017958]|uniref:hypothetical protein n=1 Tax=Streptomyces sp. NPDC017958 TaxID=3365021 RepID=UPI0037B8BB23